MDIPRYWRLRNQRYHLEGSQCTNCGRFFFPPRQICPVCKQQNMRAHKFKGTGKVFSYSVVYQTSERFEGQAPYVVALIELDEGVRLTAQLTDVDLSAVEMSLPVEMVVRKIFEEGNNGPIFYGYKFRPRLQFANGK